MSGDFRKRAVPGAFASNRKADPQWNSGKIPEDAEVNYAEKQPKGALEFWKYVLSLPSASTIATVTWTTDYGQGCAKALNVLIKRIGMARLMELGAYYVKNWRDIKKAYNWQHPASAVQFCMFIDKIDFCATNGIPLNPSNRVVGGEDYYADPFAAMEEAAKKKSGS